MALISNLIHTRFGDFRVSPGDTELDGRQWKTEILSGLTVALALVPGGHGGAGGCDGRLGGAARG